MLKYFKKDIAYPEGLNYRQRKNFRRAKFVRHFKVKTNNPDKPFYYKRNKTESKKPGRAYGWVSNVMRCAKMLLKIGLLFFIVFDAATSV